MSEPFDIAFIGTSPRTLLEGLRAAEARRRIVFVDRAQRPGGAWAACSMLGYDNVEPGVHLVENRRSLNAELLHALPGACGASAGGFGMIGRRRVPMATARVMLYATVGLKALRARQWQRARHSFGNALSAAANLGTPFVYPAAGFGPALAQLVRTLEAAGATFRFATEATIARPLAGQIALETANDPVRARKLVMTARAHVPVAGSEALYDQGRAHCVRNLVLTLADAAPRFEGYVEIMGDAYLKRVRNLSAFCGTAPGTSVLVVQVREGADCDPAVVAGHLAGRGLIHDGATVIAAEQSAYRYVELPEVAMARLEADPLARTAFLRTIDLSDRQRAWM